MAYYPIRDSYNHGTVGSFLKDVITGISKVSVVSAFQLIAASFFLDAATLKEFVFVTSTGSKKSAFYRYRRLRYECPGSDSAAERLRGKRF